MANEVRIPNGLALDFVPGDAGGTDQFLLKNTTTGIVTKVSSIPASRVSGGGNLTEATSSVLSITGGTGSVLGNVSIQVSQAGAGQSGYLSSTDWNTFNNKLSTTLQSARIFVGSSGNVATGVEVTGDVSISNTGVVSIGNGVIVNADINASAEIAFSKMAELTTHDRALVSNGGGVVIESAVTTTELEYLSGVTSPIQVQLNTLIATQNINSLVSSPTASEDGYTITWDNTAGEYTLIDPVTQGIPAGGTIRQIFAKSSNTDYETAWIDLLVSDLSDLSASVNDLDVLIGADSAGITPTIIGYLSSLTSDVQTQLNQLEPVITGAATSITSSNLPTGRVLISDASGKIGFSSTLSTELGQWWKLAGTSTLTAPATIACGTSVLSFTGTGGILFSSSGNLIENYGDTIFRRSLSVGQNSLNANARLWAQGDANDTIQDIVGIGSSRGADATGDLLEINASDNNFGSSGAANMIRVVRGTTNLLTLTRNGNLGVGAVTGYGSGVGVIGILNAITPPIASVTDGVVLWAEDITGSSELRVRDEAGNVTTLSPHNFSLIPDGESEDGAWAHFSEYTTKEGGRERINADILNLIRTVEDLYEKIYGVKKQLVFKKSL